ncbi:zinc carboxypeptidase-like [Copidosoma floridanum]|uniref:zinc carboxypeptidase-like n=1 Tax=Copidosoma floridanum TaxID=29053 RepID=UPI0006C99AE0|nr:zinc carboxypeptidase-like [Copidosoma floridanum]
MITTVDRRKLCDTSANTMKLIVLLLTIAVALAGAEKATFKNYRVFRIVPKNARQLEVLKRLDDQSEGFSYWKAPSRLEQTVDLMVSPDQMADFARLMNDTGTPYETYIGDVQSLIENENPPTRESGFGWTRYHSLEEIYSWLDSLAQRYPGKVELLSPGETYEGRQIRGVKLSFGPTDKPAVFVEGGIHAREWISPATVTYLIGEFLTSDDPEVRALAEAYDWFLFPNFNPDGYVYTHTRNRLWRKTVSRTSFFCMGSDINRNWGYMWMKGGASRNPCAETYAGRGPFSEVETRSMSRYISSIGDKLFAYIAFHSYSQLLLFSYGHTRRHLDNYDESYAMGTKAIEALARRNGTKYKTGNIAETIYVATGSSMDWVKATLKVPVAFTYELRDTGKHGFILPADQIVPNGQEVLDSLVAMFKEASRFGYPKPHQ